MKGERMTRGRTLLSCWQKRSTSCVIRWSLVSERQGEGPGSCDNHVILGYNDGGLLTSPPSTKEWSYGFTKKHLNM